MRNRLQLEVPSERRYFCFMVRRDFSKRNSLQLVAITIFSTCFFPIARKAAPPRTNELNNLISDTDWIVLFFAYRGGVQPEPKKNKKKLHPTRTKQTNYSSIIQFTSFFHLFFFSSKLNTTSERSNPTPYLNYEHPHKIIIRIRTRELIGGELFNGDMCCTSNERNGSGSVIHHPRSCHLTRRDFKRTVTAVNRTEPTGRQMSSVGTLQDGFQGRGKERDREKERE